MNWAFATVRLGTATFQTNKNKPSTTLLKGTHSRGITEHDNMLPEHKTAPNALIKTNPALSPGAAFIKEQLKALDAHVRERRRGWLYRVFCGLVELGLTEQEAGTVLAEVLVPEPRNARKEASEL
jgi:hypothetical protein